MIESKLEGFFEEKDNIALFKAQSMCLEYASQQESPREAIKFMNAAYAKVTERHGSAKSLMCKCKEGKRPLQCHKYNIFMDSKWLLVYLDMKREYN